MNLENQYNLSNFFYNDLFGRIFQSMAVYISFIILLNAKGPDQTFSLILPVSTGLAVFYQLKDNNFKDSFKGVFSVDDKLFDRSINNCQLILEEIKNNLI